MKIEPIQGTTFDSIIFRGFGPVGKGITGETRLGGPVEKEGGLLLRDKAVTPEGVGEKLDIIA